MSSLSNEQFGQMSQQVAEEGGGSFDWHTGKPVEGPGFMVSHYGAETEVPEATPEALKGFYEDPTNASLAEKAANPTLGAWGSGPSVLDVSQKIESPQAARATGVREKQEALFALRGTEVMPGLKAEDVANPWGAEVLLHSQLHGPDADPKFRPNRRLFTANEVENPEWEKTQGELNGEPVKYGDILRALNKARTERLRGQSG